MHYYFNLYVYGRIKYCHCHCHCHCHNHCWLTVIHAAIQDVLAQPALNHCWLTVTHAAIQDVLAHPALNHCWLTVTHAAIWEKSRILTAQSYCQLFSDIGGYNEKIISDIGG